MDKLEKHIKDKLNGRELPPSPQAWEKVASQLGNKDAKQKKGGMPWMAIAASFVGILLLSLWYFTGNGAGVELPIPEVQVVKEDEKDMRLDNTPEEAIQPSETELSNVQKASDQLIEGVVKKAMEAAPLVEIEKNTQVVEIMESNTKETVQPAEARIDGKIAIKLEAVLAQVTQMEGMAMEVSDAEIDSLLLAAQRELLTEQALGKGGKVDAMALLNEVELELYDDQRNPLFIKLKEGFFKLRTAVASRNQ